MRAVKGRNTAPEKLVRRVIDRMGYRFRLCCSDLPGTPDIVVPIRRVAIFVHGCFWHGHPCKRGALPKTNTEFWKRKIAGNITRDKRQARRLRSLGWRVLNVWQCQTKDENRLVIRLRRFLQKASPPLSHT